MHFKLNYCLWVGEILFVATWGRQRFITSRLSYPQQFLKRNFYYESMIYISEWSQGHF